jgi:hypothetical protein
MKNKTKPTGLIDWFHILAKINDDDLQVICGTDAALYLIFIRFSAVFFGVISLFNLLTVIPLYLTGDPLHQESV